MLNARASFHAMLAQQPLPVPYAPQFPSYLSKDTSPSHPFIHRQPPVEVIQLIEVPPPPPRSHPFTSTYASSSFASSSCDSSDEHSEEDESVGSSYCSSEGDIAADQAPSYDDTYKTRLSRVLAWREGFVKAVESDDDDEMLLPAPPSSPVSSSPALSLKRKADSDVEFDSDDETSSQSSRSSKRSRSHSPEERTPPPFQQRRLSAHSCPACDACFNTIQSLRHHGNSGLNDACREAVEYGFEP